MRSALVLMIASFLLSQPVVAGKARPIEFNDLMRMKRVRDLTASPAGEYIAFTLYEFDLDGNTTNSYIWIASLETGESKQLTRGDGSDHSPAWSPDGSHIAFISERSGTSQIWTINLRGGEAERLTDISTGADRVIWSPDGSMLCFTSRVYPDCPDDDCNRSMEEEREEEGISARLIDRLLYRHWNRWRDGKWQHLFIIRAEGGEQRELTPGRIDVPPVSLWGRVFGAFTPDNNYIVFPSNMEELPAASTNIDLYRVSIEGVKLEKLTENPANDNTPVFSPSGRYLAYRAMERPGYESDRYRLMLKDSYTGESRTLADDLDRSIGSDLCWSPDENSLFFSTDDTGRKSIFQVRVEDGGWDRLTMEGDCYSVTVSHDPPMLVFLKESLNRPAEIYTLELTQGEVCMQPVSKSQKLTGFNDSVLNELDMRRGESFSYAGADNDSVWAWMVKPPGFNPRKKYPAVFLIHGGPQGAFTDEFHYRWNAQMFASPGYVVIMPNFRGSTGYGQVFTDRINRDWGGRPFWDIMRCVDYVTEEFGFVDPNRIGAAGASYGGYMINWIEGHTKRFKCLISHAGVYDLTSEYGATEELWFPEWEFGGPPWENPDLYIGLSPSTYASNFETPCLVIHGEKDYRVPFSQGLGLFTALQRQRVPSRLLFFPDEDHFVSKPKNRKLWWSTVLDWLEKYLK
ncbi:MAG: S9 family peptidase [Candidatus Glassbacteria bacterium]